MDEEYDEIEIDTIEVEYAPMVFSWRTLAHNTLTMTAAVVRVGAEYLDSIATQVGCSNQKWRENLEAVNAQVEARRMLSALDDL